MDVFQTWFAYANETLRLRTLAHTSEDYDALKVRTAERYRLWQACLAAGYTDKDGRAAIERERAVGE